MYQLHVNICILYPPCGNQFFQAKIYPDTFYYLRDRKVPDHSNDARTRPVYVAIEIRRVESHRRRPRSRRSRKGNRRKKKERRKRKRERARFTGWRKSQSYRQRYKEAALMKQMHTRNWVVQRYASRSFETKTNLRAKRAYFVPSFHRLFSNMAWKLEINNTLCKLTGASFTMYTNVFFLRFR